MLQLPLDIRMLLYGLKETSKTPYQVQFLILQANEMQLWESKEVELTRKTASPMTLSHSTMIQIQERLLL